MQLLATKLGESPRPEFVTSYGEYPAEAYLDAFGSWPEALAAASLDQIDEEARERRKYTRVEILDALVELGEELGHPPSKGEMNENGAMSASPVQSRFEDWETALELAGVADDDFTDDGARKTSAESELEDSERTADQDQEEPEKQADILEQIEAEMSNLRSPEESD